MGVQEHITLSRNTVETRIKETVFIRTLRLKFNLLNPMIKNLQEAEIWKVSYTYIYIRKKVFRVVFLHPIHTIKLNQLRVNQVMVCCILIGQSNNTNSFDWLEI